jgi:hypothetical protein
MMEVKPRAPADHGQGVQANDAAKETTSGSKMT